MADDHIRRLQVDPDGLDFAGLRGKGIDFLQGLSRNGWTDYNLHDPGVTLLETLCYGLTDLVYRTDFNVEDFLTDESGTISYHAQALFPPQDIFPNAPVTDIDFCKLIYDREPEIDDVWIVSHPPGEAESGLFRVYIKPSTLGNGRKAAATLPDKVMKLLSEHRNLCRDVDRVTIVKTQACMLYGEIEVDDSRPATDIYADIYFRCAKAVSSGGQIVRFEEALNQGMRWEDLLCGPLTTHGYINDSHFDQANYNVDVSTLISLVRHIPGVRQVRELRLLDQNENPPLAQSAERRLELVFPGTEAALKTLQLVRGKREGHAATQRLFAQHFLDQVNLQLRKLEFEYDAFRNNENTLPRLVALPQGQYRDMDDYTSVGEHTPAIYGINHHGVPRSDPPEVHARAWQLKAYLYPFEQMMANYLASLQNIKRLYSIDAELDQTYFSQFLRDAQVPNLEMLYSDKASPMQVDKVLRGQDTVADRRNRVLDSMLALYGEVFPAAAVRRYAVYHADGVEEHLIRCKIGLLNQLCGLSANRGNAMNVQKEYWTGFNYAPLQHRVQLLSGGSEHAIGRPLSAGINNDKVKFVSDHRYLGMLEGQDGYPQTIASAHVEPLAWSADDSADELLELPHGALSPALMRAGVYAQNYRVLPDGDGSHGWLCLSMENGGCLAIARKPMDELPRYGRQLRNRLIALSAECEGFHLLEHVLLRPRDHRAGHQLKPRSQAHRVSVILPGFTARYADPGCRAWMEELIAQNFPAHILPHFYWLDFVHLAHFEQMYRHWLELLASVSNGHAAQTAQLYAAAVQLTRFLDKMAGKHRNRVWV